MVQRDVWIDHEFNDVRDIVLSASPVCVALVGAGGKSTLATELSDCALARGLTVLMTTTTKIWPPRNMPLMLSTENEELEQDVARTLSRWKCLAVGRAQSIEGKVLGLSPDKVDSLHAITGADITLCEADGAAGRPLKVHGSYEPLIPTSASFVIVVAGLDAVGQRPGPESIHRFDRFQERFPGYGQSAITPELVAAVLLSAAEHAPPRSSVVFVLNKADDVQARAAGRIAALVLRDRAPQTAITIASRAPW